MATRRLTSQDRRLGFGWHRLRARRKTDWRKRRRRMKARGRHSLMMTKLRREKTG
jgi:hypothetical protein